MLSLRQHKISRLEEFSDAVFGFALTLLVVSSVVPRSYAELLAVVHGIPSFAFCFALIVWIWHEHDSFFGRYPIQDGIAVLLNSALLFVVLLYVYALKFMFDAFMFQVFGLEGMSPVKPMTLPELPGAFALYGLGFFILMLLFAALYLHANRRRAALGLSALDAFDARALAGHHLVSSGIGLILAAFAWFGPADVVFLAPMAFVLMGPGHWAFGRAAAKRRKSVIATPSVPSAPSVASAPSASVKSVSSVKSV
jgi:hypothetical protein